MDTVSVPRRRVPGRPLLVLPSPIELTNHNAPLHRIRRHNKGPLQSLFAMRSKPNHAIARRSGRRNNGICFEAAVKSCICRALAFSSRQFRPLLNMFSDSSSSPKTAPSPDVVARCHSGKTTSSVDSGEGSGGDDDDGASNNNNNNGGSGDGEGSGGDESVDPMGQQGSNCGAPKSKSARGGEASRGPTSSGYEALFWAVERLVKYAIVPALVTEPLAHFLTAFLLFPFMVAEFLFVLALPFESLLLLMSVSLSVTMAIVYLLFCFAPI